MTDRAPALGRTPAIVGREAELEHVEAFVAAVPHGPAALLILGEPGIGKTTLWRHGVELCRRAGHAVLLTRPAEEEMPLSLVGLVDLFEGVDVDPAALTPDGEPSARGRAVLGSLRSLAERSPLVVAIDDVQWLDSVSAHALRFALRRLEGLPVGVLATTRPGGGPLDLLTTASFVPPERGDVVDIGPLGLEELRSVLAGAVSAISRPALRRIHEASGGNPLYAIELARGLVADGRTARPGVAVPLPESLQAAIARRLDDVPDELRPLLETVAALGTSSVAELRRALPGAEIEGRLALAAERGLLVVEEDLHVRYTHPLVASAVYGRMSPLERRELHAHLSELAPDPDARARHLVLCTDEPDAEVAALVEAAAERARERGASDLAAEFARHSVRLTPPGDVEAARRRAIAEIAHLAAAGEASRARDVIDRLVATLPPGRARAEALVQRFYVESDDLRRADSLLVEILEDAADDVLLRGRVLDMLGWLRGGFQGDLRSGVECAREAAEIADAMEDAPLQILATGHLGHMEALAGRPDPERMARALAFVDEAGRPQLGGGPRAWAAKQLLWSGDIAGARAAFEEALGDDVRAGNELERPYRLYDLALVDVAAGDLSSAAELARRGIEAARDAGNTDAEGWLLYPLALAEAWLGREDRARTAAEGLDAWGRRRGGLPGIVRARSALGVLHLARGDADSAARELEEGARLLDEWGFGHPGALPIVPDAVEALARTGRPAQAERFLEVLERQAERLEADWAWAVLERSRGVLLLAGGDPDAAVAGLESAGATFDRLGHRPDAARAVLERGRAHLRAGRRSVAAGVLVDARERFAAMGAALWAARADEELERAAPGSTSGDLTPAEGRIVGLVVRGMKNREIAQALYISVATVEAHLTRVYRKLGVRSRSALARLVAEGTVVLGDDATPVDPVETARPSPA
jgi:DNA-binding CsgD family transcriptional regulator